MKFLELIKEARTVRRYKQTEITREVLEELVDCGRLSPCGANQQKLKYLLVNNAEQRNLIFPLIKWAGALKDWDGPNEDERPMAYIVILLDKSIAKTPGVDHGIAAQSIMLGARSIGIGCCMIGAYNKPVLEQEMRLPENLESVLILALGEPAETVILEEYDPSKGLSYYRDDEGNHHVPKRTRDEVIWK